MTSGFRQFTSRGALLRAALIAACVAVPGVLGVSGATASGCSTTWDGSSWSNGPPTPASDVCVAGRLAITGSVTWNTATVQGSGRLRVGDGENTCGGADALTLSSGGSIEPGGKLVMWASGGCGGGPTSLAITSGALTNAGELDALQCDSPDPCLGGTRTISGDLSNSGTFKISGGIVGTYQGAGTLTNTGTISTSGSGSFAVQSGAGATVRNQSGTIDVGEQTTIESGNTFVQGAGTVTGQGLTIVNSELDLGGAGAASFVMSGADTLTGDVRVGQTLAMLNAGGSCPNPGDDVITASASFTNAGTIALDNHGNMTCGVEKLVVPSGATMTNTGTLLTANCQCGGREIDGNLVNSGGTLQLGDRTTYGGPGSTFSQTAGSTNISGQVDLTPGPATLTLSGGTLTGDGTLRGSLDNTGGRVAQSIDGFGLATTIGIRGDYTQGAGGTLAAQNDQNTFRQVISVDGAATLDGTLELSTTSGFTPDPNRTYLLVGARLVQGTFATIKGQFPSPGTGYDISYQPTTVQMSSKPTHALTLTLAGTGTGRVTSSPKGIDCGATCSAEFIDGNIVTLTATPAQGSEFDGWTGDCSGSTSTCQVTISGARAATATFGPSPGGGGTPPGPEPEPGGQPPPSPPTRPPVVYFSHAPLPPGVTLETPARAYGSSGRVVPVLQQGDPFKLNVKLDLPSRGPPGETRAFVDFAGLAGLPGNGTVQYSLGIGMFAVSYGPDGLPIDVTPAATASIDCRTPAGGRADPCAQLWSMLHSTPGSPGQAKAGSPRHRGAPVSAAGCPPGYYDQIDIRPDDGTAPGGVDLVNHIPGQEDGHFLLNQVQVPLKKFENISTDTSYTIGIALRNSIIDAGNLGLNVLLPPVALYNGFVASLRAEGSAQHTVDPALARAHYVNAAVQMAAGGSFPWHGATSFVNNVYSAGINTVTGTGNAGLEQATTFQLNYPDCPPGVHTHKEGALYIDPSGTVETTAHAPIAHAKVTLSRSDTASGRPSVVPNGSTIMSPGNRRNPDLTNQLGEFGWDVQAGFYRVSATHSGCRAAGHPGATALSPLLPVPPAQTDVRLLLRCPKLHRQTVAARFSVRRLPGALGGYGLTASVRARSGRGVPAGTVTFRAGKFTLGAAAIDTRAHTANLSVPSYRLPKVFIARYSGDAKYRPTIVRARARRVK